MRVVQPCQRLNVMMRIIRQIHADIIIGISANSAE